MLVLVPHVELPVPVNFQVDIEHILRDSEYAPARKCTKNVT